MKPLPNNLIQPTRYTRADHCVIQAKETLSAGEERFELWRNAIGLPLGPLLGLVIFLMPIQTLNPKAHILAAIFLWVITWWICEPVPIPITALLGAVLCVISGIAGAKVVFAPLADPPRYTLVDDLTFNFIGSSRGDS